MITISQVQRLDGTGYSVKFDGTARLQKLNLGHPDYADLHAVVTLFLTGVGNGLYLAVCDGISNDLTIGFTSTGTVGYYDIEYQVNVGVWYTFVLPISDLFFTKNAVILDLDVYELCSTDPQVAYVFWTGVFRASAFSDDYCISCVCGKANNVDSGIRDCDMDDCYLTTTNSDLTITEDIVVDSNNAKLTLYGTLGEGMRLKVTISWEIAEAPQTDKVLYATTLPYAFDLDIECPSIDMVTKIIIENILAP